MKTKDIVEGDLENKGLTKLDIENKGLKCKRIVLHTNPDLKCGIARAECKLQKFHVDPENKGVSYGDLENKGLIDRDIDNKGVILFQPLIFGARYSSKEK